MSSIINFSEAVKAIIEAGQEVVEGNVVKVIADNGTEIGNAVKTTVTGSNGNAANVYSMTGEVVGGTATTTGFAFLSMNLPTVAAAIAPCLGVVAGYGLYNLAPDFWTRLSDALMTAGKTIGGKVIAYFNGDNIGFDAETIEIFKQMLVDEGVFDDAGIKSMITADNTELTVEGQLFKTTQAMYIGTKSGQTITSIISFSKPVFLLPGGSVLFASETDHDVLTATITQSNGNVRTVLIGSGALNTSFGKNYSASASTFQWYYPVSQDMELISCTPATSATVDPSGVQPLGYLYLYGSNGETEYPLQPDATYPDDDPFPLKYPDWLPWEYPQTTPNPSDMPEIRPTKYPETQPDPYPQQDPAQSPDPESVPDTWPEIIPDFELPEPDPNPSPQPEPEVDPDPEPQPVPIPDKNPVPPPQVDPPEPNPDPDPSPITPVPPLPDSVSSSKLFTVYNPSSAQLDSLGGYLWDLSLMETLKKIWQDPLDGIISLIQVYVTPSISGAHNIILGCLDSGVSANVVSNQFVSVDCGSVTIEENKNNATDYAPYTSLHLYLPFVGIVELDVNECMGATLNIKYKVDVYTGTCLAQLTITRSEDMPNGCILYTYSGNCSQQIPLTSVNAGGILSSLVSCVGAGLSIAAGGGLGVIAGAEIAGRSLTHEMLHVSHSGNISANAGILGVKKPYLIIGRRHNYDATNYNTQYGYPSNKTVYLGNSTGFVRVKAYHLQSAANQIEKDEIDALLKSGVII